MLALSIRQPWASMIFYCGKDVENRTWSTRVRGRVLIHAALGGTRLEFDEAMGFASKAMGRPLVTRRSTVPRGCIIGSVEIVDCVTESPSPWFTGGYGFVLRDPQLLPFTPWKGRLGFFDVPDEALLRVKSL